MSRFPCYSFYSVSKSHAGQNVRANMRACVRASAYVYVCAHVCDVCGCVYAYAYVRACVYLHTRRRISLLQVRVARGVNLCLCDQNPSYLQACKKINARKPMQISNACLQDALALEHFLVQFTAESSKLNWLNLQLKSAHMLWLT